MTHALVSTSNFLRGLKRLSRDDQLRARETLKAIVQEPYSFKQLRGRYQDLRSARFGNHGILYSIKEDEKEIVLFALEPRSQVYQR